MATAIKNLTRMGTDVRKIAALLKAKAPEGHMLAYISPEEAQVLKDRGGSGKPHADTGIPSFEEIDTSAGGTSDEYGTVGTGGALPSETQTSEAGGNLTPLTSYNIPESQPIPNVQAQPEQAIQPVQGYVPTPTAPVSTPAPAYGAALDAGQGDYPSTGKIGQEATTKDTGKGMSDQTMKQLGIAGLGALLGASQARKAAASGQAGAQQLQQLATPYQVQGQQLQAQAQAGQLTPAGQQSLQALQAQVAQGAQARGGVGVQQGAQAVEALRQQLLAGQYQLGLQISGIGDKIATGAIQAGMQADQYTNQLTSSYFNNIARIASGIPLTTTTTTTP